MELFNNNSEYTLIIFENKDVIGYDRIELSYFYPDSTEEEILMNCKTLKSTRNLIDIDLMFKDNISRYMTARKYKRTDEIIFYSNGIMATLDDDIIFLVARRKSDNNLVFFINSSQYRYYSEIERKISVSKFNNIQLISVSNSDIRRMFQQKVRLSFDDQEEDKKRELSREFISAYLNNSIKTPMEPSIREFPVPRVVANVESYYLI